MQKKILFILQLPPPVHGSSMVGEYIKKSKQINTAFKCRFINLLASKNVSDSGKVNLRKVYAFVKIWLMLFRELAVNKPDLCYLALTSTGFAFFRDVTLIILLKTFRVKRLYHMHNKGVSEFQENVIYDFFYRVVFKGARVILLSNYLYSDIEKYVSKHQVNVCPNGIPESDAEAISMRNWSERERVRILFLSNLIETKGVKILLESCERLNERNLNFECVLIGGEGDISKEQLNTEIKSRNLEGRVNYLGKKYGKDKEKEFLKADIFAFPTFYEKECLPLVLLEAQQYGLPIVSTFEGAICDIVESGENGYLVSQKDVCALTEKLDFLIQNSNTRKKLGKSAQYNYEQKFTLKNFEKRMTEILNISLGQNETRGL